MEIITLSVRLIDKARWARNDSFLKGENVLKFNSYSH